MATKPRPVPQEGTLFRMADQKQADKVSKVWANLEWAKRHNARHKEDAPVPSCPFCFPPKEQS